MAAVCRDGHVGEVVLHSFISIDGIVTNFPKEEFDLSKKALIGTSDLKFSAIASLISPQEE